MDTDAILKKLVESIPPKTITLPADEVYIGDGRPDLWIKLGSIIGSKITISPETK